MKTYIYKGNEAGVPGLPHEVTDEEARALGVEDTLKAAIKSGVYVEKTAPKSKAERKEV